jgi:hypothetical protein
LPTFRLRCIRASDNKGLVHVGDPQRYRGEILKRLLSASGGDARLCFAHPQRNALALSKTHGSDLVIAAEAASLIQAVVKVRP